MESAQAMNVAKGIAYQVAAHFKENLASVLLYGSSQKQEQYWDLDFLILLKEKKSAQADLSFLRTIVTDFKDHTLDLQVLYSNELSSADAFSIGTSGAFFPLILANAVVLYGENPFKTFIPSDQSVSISLLNRIQGYIFKARQEYIGVIERDQKDKNPNYHQKHIRRVILDIVLMMGGQDDVGRAQGAFQQRFPEVLSDAQWKLLTSNSDDIAEYIEIYERLYDVALEISYMLLPRQNSPVNKATLDDITFEYLLPPAYTDAVIVVDGLPRTPELRSFMNLVASWGYAAFFPRLKGTWESGGEFLDHNPAQDIQDFAQKLRSGITLQGSQVKAERVLVLGASFGGLVALGASLHVDVARTISLSPVYAMSAVTGIDTLGPYLRETYRGAYRYAEGNWEKLIRDEILSLRAITDDKAFLPEKCVIIAAEQDDQIGISGLRSICDQQNIALHTVPTRHISLHRDILAIRPLLFKLIRTGNNIA